VKIDTVSQRGGLCRAIDDSYRTKNLMLRVHRLGTTLLIVCAAIFFSIAIPWLHSRASSTQQKTQAAIQEYETALKLEPKDKTAREALKRLRKDAAS